MEQAREQLIRYGLDRIADEGVSIRLDAVTLAGAADALRLPRSEVEDLWRGSDGEASPEERYREAIAVRILEEQPAVGDAGGIEGTALTETLLAVSSLMEAMPDLAELSPTERGDWLRRI